MKAEEVYNIAIHLPEKEMDKLYTLLEKRVCKNYQAVYKSINKKLITDDEARSYILKSVFGIAPTNNSKLLQAVRLEINATKKNAL